MCTQVAVDGNEIPTSPGRLVPVALDERSVTTTLIPLSKSVFAREVHLWRAHGVLPCASEEEAREAARRHVTRQYGPPQVMWFHSGFARACLRGVTRFAEKDPAFDPSWPVNEETNPFFLWFDAPAGSIVPLILSIDAHHWDQRTETGLRVVANILTRDAGRIVPTEIHGREPCFMAPAEWFSGAIISR